MHTHAHKEQLLEKSGIVSDMWSWYHSCEKHRLIDLWNSPRFTVFTQPNWALRNHSTLLPLSCVWWNWSLSGSHGLSDLPQLSRQTVITTERQQTLNTSICFLTHGRNELETPQGRLSVHFSREVNVNNGLFNETAQNVTWYSYGIPAFKFPLSKYSFSFPESRKFYPRGTIHICTCVEKLVTMLWTLQDGSPWQKSIRLGSIFN